MGGQMGSTLDGSSEDRVDAVFKKFGRAGQVYAPAIAGMFGDESPNVRVAAIESVALMGERGAALVDEIAQCLEDPEGDVRAAAVAALAKFGEGAAHCREYLELMATDDSLHQVRSAAGKAIDVIGNA